MVRDEYKREMTDILGENLLNINSYIFKNLKDFNIPLRDFLNEFEKKIIEYVLILTNGNQKRAAFLLGVKNSTFCEKVKRYRILLTKFENIEVSMLNYQEIISSFFGDYHSY